MSLDDRFDGLLDDLAGYYRTWLVYLGVELGLLHHLRAEGGAGLTADALAEKAGCGRAPVDGWCRAAYAYGLLERAGGDDLAPRFGLDEDLAAILLDPQRPEYLGGQFIFSVGASLEYGGMVDFFRSGRPVPGRTPRYHRAVERLNEQDIAVFFEQALPQLPDIEERLRAGTRVLDVACGGGGWLTQLARTFPAVRAMGIEFDEDWLSQARRRIAEAGLTDRVQLERGDPAQLPGHSYGLVYYQDVLHELPDPAASLRAAGDALAPGGSIVVLDWCLPGSMEEYRTLLGQLTWGYQLDELFQGTSLLTRGGFVGLFEAAGLGPPMLIELDAGASLFVARRPAG
ncbi:MAG TPA: class I SAM-dependent methyltransferase [Candidatus Limnocylindrales bacterium]|nr:class I SAM-dependent methyltransferase [Candidatus Limnocylindrales bacterium]